LGGAWWLTETSVKPYPPCRYGHAAIDALRRLQREGRVSADDVVGIEVRLSPAAYSISQFRDPHREIADDHIAPYAVQFNMPTLAALALLGVPPGPAWHRPEVFGSDAVRSLAARVTVSEDPVLAKEWHETIAGSGEKVRRTRGSITVTTRSETEVIESDFALGDPWEQDTRMTWNLLADKLATFGEGMLDAEQQRALLDGFRTLDDIDDVATGLVPLLVPGGEREVSA